MVKYWAGQGKRYYLKSADRRWEYIAVVMDMLKEIKPDTSIEMGCWGIPCISDSVTVDNVRIDNTYPQRLLDGDITPYPFKTGEFDVFIALQVFEHLRHKEEAFREAKRVAGNVILSLPYNITGDVGNDHVGIGDAEIERWFGKPDKSIPVGNRIVCLWAK